jgi:hypothetical protein
VAGITRVLVSLTFTIVYPLSARPDRRARGEGRGARGSDVHLFYLHNRLDPGGLNSFPQVSPSGVPECQGQNDI